MKTQILCSMVVYHILFRCLVIKPKLDLVPEVLWSPFILRWSKKRNPRINKFKELMTEFS